MGKKRAKSTGSSRRRSGLNTQQWVILTVVAAMIVGVLVIAGTGGLGGVLSPSPGGGAGSAAGALSLVDRGNAAYDSNDYVAAIGYYEQALKQRADDVNMLVDLGTAYYYKQPPDPTRAIYYYDKALQIDPKFPNALFNKAVVLSGGRGDYAGAVAVLQDYLKLYPSGQQSDRAKQMIKDFTPYAKSANQPTGGSQPAGNQPGSNLPVSSQPVGNQPAPGSPLATGFGN